MAGGGDSPGVAALRHLGRGRGRFQLLGNGGRPLHDGGRAAAAERRLRAHRDGRAPAGGGRARRGAGGQAGRAARLREKRKGMDPSAAAPRRWASVGAIAR